MVLKSLSWGTMGFCFRGAHDETRIQNWSRRFEGMDKSTVKILDFVLSKP